MTAIQTGDNFCNAVEGRVGNWIQTYSGGQFWPLDPCPTEIWLEDIAHALSNLCRFAGHCERFYSVAEHSVYVSRCVPSEHALAALLHDATEAYVIDLPRPLKPAVPEYRAIEGRVWEAVACRFGLPLDLPDCIKLADNAVLLAERDQIMKAPAGDWCLEGQAADVTIVGMSPEGAKHFFLNRFWELQA